jgi:hypothetical protein
VARNAALLAMALSVTAAMATMTSFFVGFRMRD